MEKILAVVPTLTDDPTDTIKSLLYQTIKISKILLVIGSKNLYKKLTSTKRYPDIIECLYVKPNCKDPVGKRVAIALNTAFSKVHLTDYDYLLRVDADAILPNRFIEENLKIKADCVGKAGYAMLIKMDSFLKFFHGRFVEIGAEDSYIGLKLLSQGCIVKSWSLAPKVKRRSGVHHSWRYYFIRGEEMYKLGYEPLHVIDVLRHDVRNLFAIIGYGTAAVKRIRRYDVANWVFRAQLKRLIYGRWN